MRYFFTKTSMVISFLLSVGVIIFSISTLGVENKEAWAVIAASLAVITSVISSWAAHQTLEMQEDALKPYPYPFFDTTSRPGVSLFRVKNFGGTVARDIELIWDLDKPFEFKRPKGEPDIKVLVPGETISYNLGTGDPEKNPSRTFTGIIKFRDASGRVLNHKFVASLGQHDHSEKVDSVEAFASLSIQDMPRMLSNIEATLNHNLGELKKMLEQYLKRT